MMKKNLNILKVLLLLMFLSAIPASVWADDFTVERAVNLSQLSSWADISQFQWQEIDHAIQDKLPKTPWVSTTRSMQRATTSTSCCA